MPKSFLVPKILIPQSGRYYTLLKFSVYISPFISVTQIIVLLPKPSGLACLLAVLINNRITSVYIPVLKLLMDLVIWVSALVLNSIPPCLISD